MNEPNGTAYGEQPKDGAPDGQQTEEARRANIRRRVLIGVAVVLVIVALLLLVRSCTGGSLRDPNAEFGQLENKTQEEIQAELDRVVEEGMFNISITSKVEFADGLSEGELRIENVPGNRYLMQVDITRDDTGELVFRSGMIEPNHHIQKAKLDQDLDPGEYECTALFSAHDPETEDLVGRAGAKLTILVAN
ncbi:hypothetical protein [Raoultibacter phocaeensis]|uniref:hypothetical protein n=1 Tax=Raoultibacter phocaeensis TaxID=2479841 RepID=UPI0011196425|nr:hypothetical protein [Raoultibacter phocaeensis]